MLAVASTILLVLAGTLLTAGQPPAQAQDDQGAVTSLSVSSPNPSQLAVAWSAPSETPTDYRVRWAPSDQDYLSFSEANTAERGSAYPSGTTHTVNNLAAGASYKVQVRARYNGGEHADNPWSGPWSDEANVTISSPPPPPPTPEPTPDPTPAPETPPVPTSDEVTSLALSSDAVGQLVITWNQPSDEPTDYRISWTPAEEDYLSYSEDNTTRRGNSYPGGDTTTLTLTDLPGGVNYKIMMRARYHDDQTNEDSSGPWSDEATRRVKDNPPAAPTGLNAAEVSHSRVTLSWTAPDHSSITGYRVLRGADADSLTVLVDDTGAINTEHLDTGVEAETSYIYAVIALSPDGSSPRSGTVSATTPAPPDQRATQQRSETTPGAPAGLRVSATSNQVTLEWDDPADDSITGYQVWRGPKSSGLKVLAADTGSGDNSYVDDAVTPETTYHYAINAINADGTGQQSDTISATTQAPPKLQQRDGETISARQSTVANPAVSNIGNLSSSISYVANAGGAYATSFTTGSDPGGYTLSGARLNVEADTGVVFTVAIHSDSSNNPGTGLRTLTHPATVDADTATTEEFTAATTVTLAASTKYWVVIAYASGDGTLGAANAASTTADSGGLPGWSIGLTRARVTSAGNWGGFPSSMAIGVLADVAVPRLTSVAITSRPLDGDTYKAGENIEVEFTFNTDVTHVGGVAAIRVGDQTDNSNYRAAGYVGGSGTLKLLYRYKVQTTDTDTTGIGVDSSALGTGGPNAIVDGFGTAATVTTSGLNPDSEHKVAGGTVGCEYLFCADVTVAALTSTALGFFYYTSGNSGALSNREFTLGQSFVVQGVVLRDGNKLEILLDRPLPQKLVDEATLHIGTTFYHFHEGTVDENRVAWPVTGLTWNDGDTSRITIQDDIFVSNLGKAAVSTGLVTDSTIEAFAQKFSTGSYANGYLVNAVELQAQVVGDSVVRVSINRDFAGAPGERIYELANPSSFSAGSAESARFTATDVHLEDNNSYWLVWKRVSGTGITAVSYANDSGEDRGVALGWSIADSVHKYNGSTWSEHTITGSPNPIMRLSIRGEESRNIAATGTISIEGVIEQGLLVAAETGRIVDRQGFNSSALNYQWIRVVGDVEGIISGANNKTYTIQATDVGNRLKVRVSFRDIAGNAESLTSDATEVVSAASSYLVSNLLGQSTDISSEHTLPVWGNIALAQDFSIGGGTGTYMLNALRLFAKSNADVDLTVSIYSDSSGSPGSSLHVLTATSNVDRFQETLDEFTGNNIILNGNTKYWLVVEAPAATSAVSGLVLAVLTDDGGEDSGAEAGSSIGNAIYQRTSGTWAQVTSQNYVLMMGLRGEVASNRAPAFTNSIETLSVNENAAANAVIGTISATDLDGDTLTYSVSGADLSAFNEDFALNTGTGQITVKSGATIDFESRSSYTITLTATDDEGDTDTVTVTINVTNIEEPGSVSLSASQPQLGVTLNATLTDPDGGVSGQGWQWARGDTANGTFANISGAASASYTPVQADVGKYLRVSVAYTDTLGSGKSATETAGNAVVATVTNQAPTFSTNARTLTVVENAATNAVVGTVSATDPNGDTLTYSVSGTDLAAFNEDFTLNMGSGQVRVKSGATIDFESRSSYAVTIGVTDSKDAFGNASSSIDDTISVTINVTNREEAGTVALSTLRPVLNLPLSATLTDPDGGVSGQSWQWSRGNTATGSFSSISGATSASYTPLQADVDRYLKVRVTYTDPLSSGRSAEAVSANPVIDVPIDNVAPAFPSTGYTRPVAENAPAGQDLGAPITARDANRDALTYSLGRSRLEGIHNSCGHRRGQRRA